MFTSIVMYLAHVYPLYRAGQDAGLDMFMNDLRALNESINPPKE